MKLSLIERIFLNHFIHLRCFTNVKRKISYGLILESDCTLDRLEDKYDKIVELEELIQVLEQNNGSFDPALQMLTNCEWAGVRDITSALKSAIEQAHNEILILERQAQDLQLIKSAVE